MLLLLYLCVITALLYLVLHPLL